MIDVYIQLKSDLNKKRSFALVRGYKLPYGLVAVKGEDNKWSITDRMTGGYVVNGLSKYKEVSSYLNDKDFIAKLSKRRGEKKYKKLQKNLDNYLKSVTTTTEMKPEEL